MTEPTGAFRNRLLDQLHQAAPDPLPEGVEVRLVMADGKPLRSFSHPNGIATVPASPETGEMDAETLRQVVADVEALPPIEPEGDIDFER